jgi:hypothetical protein
MSETDRPDVAAEARAAYTVRSQMPRREGSKGNDGSPLALEATLASISEEVTAEASERRRLKGKARD